MLENVRRKVVLIVLLLLVSVGLLVLPEQPFRLGLDLQGGTRLAYRFDFEAARERGEISPNEDTEEILSQAVIILRNRVDPTGTLDPVIRTEGKERVIFELPGNVGREGAQARSRLEQPLDETQVGQMVLADATRFPLTGVVQVGREQIRFEGREGNALTIQRRAHNGITEAHIAGDPVELVNTDAIRAAIENLGELSFRLVVEPRDLVDLGTDIQSERTKLDTWMAANPGVPLVAFNSVPPEQGGPNPVLRWYPVNREGVIGEPMPVLVPRSPEENIRGEDLARIYPSMDRQGYPAVGFEIRPTRIDDFADFTGDNLNRMMAIILNDEIRTYPALESKLVGGGIVEGRFTPEEVKNLITVLRSGSLKLKPILESDERVGATLGDDYVQRGLYSGICSMVLVLLFMVVYYRRLGIFAALALLTNLIMFMGGLAFLRATLTLPGIAGIVLTVGMAVDANILIFDRLREEAEKGRNARQAAKAGFDKALSAIIDSNVTTFLTAVILYRLGTGPVRGFAVTLMIGILTSVFAALVTTRVFVHWALTRGAQGFKMGRWMADANYDFLGKTRVAVAISSLVCLGGLAGFLITPNREKLGIDFTGGVEAQIHTAQAQTVDTIRDKVAGIAQAGIGESAEVRPVLNAEQETGTYTRFRITFKTVSEESRIGQGEELRPVLKQELSELLLAEPIQARVSDETGAGRAEVDLYFEEVHPEADVSERLEAAGLKDVQLRLGDRAGAYHATATTSPGRSANELSLATADAFRDRSDSAGRAFLFADPIPSFSQVGPQVVGELRDKALLALAVSLFITVIYIRVRFAEYSFGIAAMVALVHDVLVTLAALTLGNHLGLVNGEMNLAMIAVFLTIIGYSVNDTIVIFDRVRENLPRMKVPLREVLNVSINETLSRTIMTSLTVFLAILVQYLFNLRTGNVLESISFAMLFGTISGVYSTVYIANPIFLWLETRSRKKRDGGAQGRAQRLAERKPVRPEDEEGLVASKSSPL